MCNRYSMRSSFVLVTIVLVFLLTPLAVQASAPRPTTSTSTQFNECVYPITVDVRESYLIPSSMVIRFGIGCLDQADYVTFDVNTQDITAQADVDYSSVHLSNLRVSQTEPAPQITLTALPDSIAEPNETLSIQLSNIVYHTASGPSEPLQVTSLGTIYDFAPPRIQMYPDPVGYMTPNCVTSEDGGTCQFDIWLNSPPTADVVFSMAVGRFNPTLPYEAQVLTGSLVFNSGNYARHQTVTVRGLNDSVVDNAFYGGTCFTVVIRTSSADPSYNGASIVYNGMNLDNEGSSQIPNGPTAPVSPTVPVVPGAPVVPGSPTNPSGPATSATAITQIPYSAVTEHLLVLSAHAPALGYDAAGGSPIHVNGQPLYLPADSDHNGYDTYAVMDIRLANGLTWIAVYIGGEAWCWLPVIVDTAQ